MPKFPPTVLSENKIKSPSDTTASEDDQKAFAKEVRLILHTCNKNEYWAVVEKLEPPTASDGRQLDDCPVKFPKEGTVIGMFAGYRVALMKTEQADQCIAPLVKALRFDFPNARAVVGVGIGYAGSQDLHFADVMVSKHIENWVQVKWENGEITNRGERPAVGPDLKRIFCDSANDWDDQVFCCTANDDRRSRCHIGCIVSAPWLVRDLVLKNRLLEKTPNVIGGEMEGWALLVVKDIYPAVGVIVIKGVADYGDVKKGDEWQLTAAKAAVDYTHFRLKEAGCGEFQGKHKLETLFICVYQYYLI